MRNISARLAVITLIASQSAIDGAYPWIGPRIGISNFTSRRPLSLLLAHKPRSIIPSATDAVCHLFISGVKRNFESMHAHCIWRTI